MPFVSVLDRMSARMYINASIRCKTILRMKSVKLRLPGTIYSYQSLYLRCRTTSVGLSPATCALHYSRTILRINETQKNDALTIIINDPTGSIVT